MSEWLLSWNPSLKADWDDNRKAPFVADWSVRSGRSILRGERVYMVRVGRAPRGIVSRGRVLRGAVPGRDWRRGSSATANYILVRWDSLVPADRPLLRETLLNSLGQAAWSPQSSGMRVKAGYEAGLDRLWYAHARAVNGTSPRDITLDTEWPEIEGGLDERLTKARRGQQAFRRALLNSYGANCAVSGPAPDVVLEAAHLYKYADDPRHLKRGGLLLRRDVHVLFDRGLLVIDGKGIVRLHSSVRRLKNYQALDGTRIRVKLTPDQTAWLARHREINGF